MGVEPGCLQKAESWVLGKSWPQLPICEMGGWSQPAAWDLLLSTSTGLSRLSLLGQGPAHLGDLGLGAGVSACLLLLRGLADGPFRSVPLQDPEQVERSVEIVEGDGGVGLAASLLHQSLHLGI